MTLGDTLVPYILDLGRRPHDPAFGRRDGLSRADWSRGQVLAAARAVRQSLERQGIPAGGRVLLQGPAGPAWVAALCGCILHGAVPVPVDPDLPAPEVDGLRDRLRAAALLDGTFLSALAPAADGAAGSGRNGAARPAPSDIAQIVLTSGTGGRMRAVPLTHRNMLAGIQPIERGFRRRRRPLLVRLVRPRLLCLVPPSHLFGQVVGVWLAMIMGLRVIFTSDLRPRAIRDLIRREGVMVAVGVPRLLRLLADDLRRDGFGDAPAGRDDLPWWRRAWRSRRLHRRLGRRFLVWVSGGAALPDEVESYWSRHGYLVVQGYGLTETAPIISVSNPFARRRGSVGKPMGGQQTRIGPDGELWVRGDNVAAGYLDDDEASGAAFAEGGWLRTGDRVEQDEQGRLYVKGRLKDVIVTADGVNVDPGAVEAALEQEPAIREAACVARAGPRGEEVHAVLVPAGHGDGPAADGDEPDPTGSRLAAAVAAANARLPAGRRAQGWSVWPEPALPRTSLGKLKRAAVRAALAAGRPVPEPSAAADPSLSPEQAALARITGRDVSDLSAGADLDAALGLGSLDRLELLVQLEQQTGRSVDESAVASARTLADLSRALEAPPAPPLPMPRWSRSWPARAARAVLRPLLVAPLFRALFRLRTVGREHLPPPPFLLVANHLSHLDTAAVLFALPPRLRPRLAVAMAVDVAPARGLALGRGLAKLLFAAYPVDRRGGFGATLDYTAELAGDGACPLIYPEGRMAAPGEDLPPFRKGPALVASRLGLPVVPAGIAGSEALLPPRARFPRPGRLAVVFGEPQRPIAFAAAGAAGPDTEGHLAGPDADDPIADLTRRLESAVRDLAVRAARTIG